MAALLQARLSRATAHEAMTTGRRYGGQDAAAAGLVEAAVPEAQVLEWAVARAGALANKDATTMGRIKERMYGDVAAILRDPEVNRLGA